MSLEAYMNSKIVYAIWVELRWSISNVEQSQNCWTHVVTIVLNSVIYIQRFWELFYVGDAPK